MELSLSIASFYFAAFSNKEKEAEIKDEEQNVSQLKQLNILLIEDDQIVQKVHCIMLERMGYNVDTASNGQQAIKIFETHHYDAIVTDIRMPDMTGIDVTKEIRRIEGKQKHTPIIAITGDAIEQVKNDCFAAGVDKFAIKPISPEELNRLLQQVIKPK